MATNPCSRSYSRRSAGVLLLVGILVGITVGGGVGVFAASSTKSVTVCVDKKDNHMNYSKDSKCKSHQNKVVLNQKGAAGAKGAKGNTGAAGAKGDTSAAGSAGAKGDKGDTGAAGSAGAKGDKGDDGADGSAGAAGASSPTGFIARSVCGLNGTTLCEVGVLGPGGGVIVYVDSTNEMSGYDYLEAAPDDASIVVVWSTDAQKCGPTASENCQTSYLSDAGARLNYLGIGTGRVATAAIVARHNAGGIDKSLYAAGVADDYTTLTASDWFLPSRDELNEVCKYARNTEQAAGANITCSGGTLRDSFASRYYLSSSEQDNNSAIVQAFYFGAYNTLDKDTTTYVRPVRAF